MRVKTSRFGDLEVEKSDLMHFKDGILGFESLKKFFIVDPGDQTLILWLQSSDDPNIAFPVLEPKIFLPGHSIKLLPAELQTLGLQGPGEANVYTILTIPSNNIKEMSANMKAPVIVNTKTKEARQIVLQDNKLEVRYPMYKALKACIAAYASDDSKRTTVRPPTNTTTNAESRDNAGSTVLHSAEVKKVESTESGENAKNAKSGVSAT